jgi:DNA mismatch repair protein MSH5
VPQRRARDDGEDIEEHVIMAVDCKDRGTVGCAYYISREERLFCMEDMARGSKDIIDRCGRTTSANQLLLICLQ